MRRLRTAAPTFFHTPGGAWMRRGGSCHQTGSALLAVFWAIAVLSMAVGGWFLWLQERVQAHGEESRGAEALAMAHSGVAMAMNPQVDRYSSLLTTEVAPGVGYRVEMEGEAGRLNLVSILGGEPGWIYLFKQWLEFVIGMELQDRDRLVDCLLDYVDADSIVRLNGQEDGADYHPANRMIQSLDELKRIPGTGLLLAYPGWRELLTVDGSGLIDLAEAPEELLKLLPGLGDGQVTRLVQMRAGTDGVLHTEDDPQFANAEAVRQALGIQSQQWARFGKMVTAGEQTFRIKSEGRSGKVVRQVQVVVRKGAGAPRILSWIE